MRGHDGAVRSAGERDRDERSGHRPESSGVARSTSRQPRRPEGVDGCGDAPRTGTPDPGTDRNRPGTLSDVDPTADHVAVPRLLRPIIGDIPRSLIAVLAGTFTLRFSTGLTGALLIYYLANPVHGAPVVDATGLGLLTAAFYLSELVLAPFFGLLSDRWGHHRVMQFGPIFGLAAAILTYLATNVVLIGVTRILEGASTAASVPSILGFIAVITMGDELLRGRAAARFEGATLAGLGAGLVAAGPIWELLHREGFLLNAAIYALSFAIYRFGVPETPGDESTIKEGHPGAATLPARSCGAPTSGSWRRPGSPSTRPSGCGPASRSSSSSRSRSRRSPTST